MSRTTRTDEILAHALFTAEAAAREAGTFLLGKRGQAEVQGKKAAHDDLLDVDLQAEALILGRLRTAFPEYGTFSEESGQSVNRSTARMWLVDPLDGSANFQHASPIFGVAIGLLEGTKTLLSAIYLPTLDEMYTASAGQGARCNSRSIHVSATAHLADAIIHVGDFATTGSSEDNQPRVAAVARLADAAYRVRMVGTAATDFAYVASGRADGLVMYRSHAWDLSAGKLLVEEAGGTASIMLDQSGQVNFNVYSNGSIHDELTNLLGI